MIFCVGAYMPVPAAVCQKRPLDCLEPELEKVMSHHLGVRCKIWVP